MRSRSRLEPRPAGEDGLIDRTALVSDSSVVCRNYDGARSHEIAVTFRDADDEVATADCLVGSGPNETALIETGNGSLSVAEGVL